MRRLALAAGCAAAALVRLQVATAEPPLETRIPHRDGSGRATIVEVDPEVPGARAFVHGNERPAPGRGELSLPSPSPTPAPEPTSRLR